MTSQKSVTIQKAAKRWELILEDFIAQNLKLSQSDPPYTLKDCANAWGVSYMALRQKSSAQKWSQQLTERRERLRLEAQERLHDVALFDEIEIRTRQATYARLASSVAYQKLQKLDKKAIERMSIKDAVELLKIGLSEERQALGLGETVNVQPGGIGENAVLSPKQVYAVARRVVELRSQEDGSEAQREPAAIEHQPEPDTADESGGS